MLESELFELLENTADAAYTVAVDGGICSWNTAAERLLGHAADEVIGRDVDDVLKARDTMGTRALAGGIDACTRSSELDQRCAPNFDLEVETRSGERLWVNVSTISFDNPRTQRQLIVRLMRNVDQQRRKEMLLSRMITSARELVQLAQGSEGHAPVSPLSDQERRILGLFAEGNDREMIASTLCISDQTLRNHLHRINRKLRTRSRLEAVTHAQRRGLLDHWPASNGSN
jgi:PAS domain S-box-containing protein